MALKITKIQPNTTIASYFTVTNVDVNKFSKKAVVTVKGYANKEAREANPHASIVSKEFTIQLDNILTNIYPEVYTKLLTVKQNPFETVAYFEGATQD